MYFFLSSTWRRPKFLAVPEVLMLVGDSNTSGWSGNGNTDTWRGTLVPHLESNTETLNLVGEWTSRQTGTYATSGWDNTYHARGGWEFPDAISGAEVTDPLVDWVEGVDLVVVALGVNDARESVSGTGIFARAEDFVETIQDESPTTSVLLCAPPPGDNAAVQQRLEDYRDELAAGAEDLSTGTSRVRWVDLFDGLNRDTITYDGLHLNETGEVEVGTRIANALWQEFRLGAPL